MIGLWEGFYYLNKGFIPSSFIVYKNGGYDGQFFFLNALYLSGDHSAPILDSFLLRFNRIGLSLIGALIIKTLGAKFYSLFLFTTIQGLHIFSAFLIKRLLKYNKNLYLIK
ncbi:MAG: hypothetical protein KDK36_10590, partial [Leptospiraceae bacterium]|nr:hypothetical protein [Leptospiraceae bacterium]